MTTHSPTPWSVEQNGTNSNWVVRADGVSVGQFWKDEDAKFVVDAVNELEAAKVTLQRFRAVVRYAAKADVYRDALDRIFHWCNNQDNTDSYARQNCEEIAREALEGGEE